jgi:hypothetical protein
MTILDRTDASGVGHSNADASGLSSLPAETNPDILTAIARAEASLRVVLTAIAELKAEMASRPTHRDQDAIPPYDTWVGVP